MFHQLVAITGQRAREVGRGRLCASVPDRGRRGNRAVGTPTEPTGLARPGPPGYPPAMNAATLLLAAVALAAEPALVAERPTAVAGTVKAGPALRHTFRLTNRSDVVVTVTGTEVSCGCLRPRLGRATLAPGASADLDLEVRTLTQPAGPNRWAARVRYQPEGGEAGQLACELSATLVREVSVEPATLAVSSDRPVSHDFAVTDRRATPLTLRAARTGVPWAVVTVGSSSRGDGGVWRIGLRLDVTDACPPGTHDLELTLTSADPDYSELRVPVRVTKRERAAVSAAPASLTLVAGTAESRLVQLRAAAGDVEVEAAECDLPGVRCRFPSGVYPVGTIRVEMTTPPAQSASGEVRVRFKQPAGIVLRLPIAVHTPSAR
jgi:hypothetical protein